MADRLNPAVAPKAQANDEESIMDTKLMATLVGRGLLRRDPLRKVYCLDEGELRHVEDKLRKEGVREGAWTISRFKGLGEMNAEQLWDTTLNPDTRRLLPIELGPLDNAGTENLMTQLMGKGEAAARRELMELHGDSVQIDV